MSDDDVTTDAVAGLNARVGIDFTDPKWTEPSPADSKAALDRMIADARADGMMESANLLFSVVSHLPIGRTYSYRNGWTDGVSDYANQSHATILAAITKGKDHE